MSEVKTYECTVLIDASCGVTVEASSPEEAAELAENAASEQGAGSLCHQCSGHTECGDSYAVIVYDGDKEVLDTDHRTKMMEAANSELAALREDLANAERKNVDQSNYLREALKRINVNQHHMFCLALYDFLNSAEPQPTESGASE